MKKHILFFSAFLCFPCQGEPLKIQTAESQVELDVELATDAISRRDGLMFVKQMDPLKGMLFIYEKPQKIKMWMKNTYIGLDMVFIDRQGKILHIHENAVPHSLATIESPEPCYAVLEINAGQSGRLGFHKGDRLLHRAFTTQ